jgi:hypothetical protein
MPGDNGQFFKLPILPVRKRSIGRHFVLSNTAAIRLKPFVGDEKSRFLIRTRIERDKPAARRLRA